MDIRDLCWYVLRFMFSSNRSYPGSDKNLFRDHSALGYVW